MSAYDDIAQGLDEIFRSAFVSGSTKGSYKQKYRPEYDRVKAYLDGGAFPNPYPTTLMGSGLTKVERGVRALAPTPPPPPSWEAPIVISSGQTISNRAFESTSSSPAILVNTTQPVRIENCHVRNLAGGPCIQCAAPLAVQVTVENCRAYGGSTYATSGRWFLAEGYKSVTLSNNTIEYTRGIQLTSAGAASTVSITKNRHTNIQGNGTSPVGNFVQFRSVTMSTVDVSWNEVVNEYNKSNPEDLISGYQSANLVIHDNFFFGHSKPGNAYNTSSQNGVTLESGTLPGSCSNNEVYNNQLVAGMAFGLFYYNSPPGSNNYFHDNRVVRSGYLDDGVTLNRNGYEGFWIATGGSNNHAHDNVIGYVNRDGNRSDGRFPGAPEGDASEWANNTHMPNPVTLATEQNEWTLWEAKLTANGITVGAP